MREVTIDHQQVIDNLAAKVGALAVQVAQLEAVVNVLQEERAGGE